MRDPPLHLAKARLKGAVAITAAAMAVAALLHFGEVLEPYSLKTLDLFFRHVPLPPASPEIVLITVDQPDLEFFRDRGLTWPWPRQLYSPIIDFCRRAGARAVILDILFSEPSSYGPEDDARLAQSLGSAGNVILPFFLSRKEKASESAKATVIEKARLSISGNAPSGLSPYRSVLAPIQPLVISALTLGNVECRPDRDGIYRRMPLVVPCGGDWLPALAFAAYDRLQPWSPYEFHGGALTRGQTRFPLDAQGQFLLKFRGPSGTYPRLSAANVIQSEGLCRQGLEPLYPLQTLAGKWVFVGLTAPGLMDLKSSPVDSIYAGVEIHATLLDNLLQGDFLGLVQQWTVWSWTLLLVAGIVVTVICSSGVLVTLGALACLLIVNIALAFLAFTASWWMDPVLPGTALVLSFAFSASYSYAIEGRQKSTIRNMFAQYMSETVISDLLQHPEKLKLGGEHRTVTIMFSDLAGFTSISERLTPETVITLLNEYFSRMTDIILEEGGTLDKFEGDAIMAFWGASLDMEDHALRACRAALRQVEALADLNGDFEKMGLPALKLRVGIHTGEAVVGNLGSQRRFDYTVIGDAVNLASRLEGLNKYYGTTLLCSESTMNACADEAEFRELDDVAVKGREAPVRVFQVLGLAGRLGEAQARARESFSRGLELYRAGQFALAGEHFFAALKILPQDGPSREFLDRCREFQRDPPGPGWDRVFRPDRK